TLNLLLKITTGQGGLWLLDPTTVTITSSGKTSNGNIDNALTQSGSVNIRDADIVSALNAGTNVVITATTSITNTVGQIGWGSNPVSGGSGDLTFTAPTINIANSITTRGAQTYNGAVNLTNSGSSSVDVVFTSNSSITFNSTVNDNGTGHGFKVVGTVVTFKENVGSTTKPNAINITASNRAYVYGNITANSINFNNLSVYATPSSVFSPTSIGTSLLYRNLYITLGIEASAVYKSSTTLNSFTSYTLTGLRASDSAITLSSITVNNGDAGSTYVTAFTLSANTSTYILGTTGQANIVTGQKTTNTVNIAKATLTISAITAQNKVYDTTNAATISAYTSNILGSDQITFTSTATFASANAGTGITVTASNITIGGTDSANYTLATTSRTTTANITKANLT
ncbi:MAG: hypothetical protein EBV74_06645, partial [Alphaproteobacteria bacterium]|nr:hypothetical protein [Candidatus Fonsibacter sp. PEL55]